MKTMALFLIAQSVKPEPVAPVTPFFAMIGARKANKVTSKYQSAPDNACGANSCDSRTNDKHHNGCGGATCGAPDAK